MTIAAFSLFGVVAGALLQFMFTRHLDHQRHVRELKTKAYPDYMRCVCELANIRTQGGDGFTPGLDTRTADAKSRISLYGSTDVIDSFAEFEKVGAQTASYEQCEVFAEMGQAYA